MTRIHPQILRALAAASLALAACRGEAERADPGSDTRSPATPRAEPPSTERSPTEPLPPAGPLTVDEAIELARAGHPDLLEARARAEAARAARRTAGRWADPSLVATAESLPIGGSDVDPDYLVGLEQPIPISGRTGAAERAADARTAELEQILAARDRAVVAEVRGAFATALVAEALLAARDAAAADAARAVELADVRANLGDAPRDELAAARLLRWRADSEARAARSAAGTARRRLQAALGAEEAADEHAGEGAARRDARRELAGDVEEVLAVPELVELSARLAESPSMKALDAESERWRRELELARAERIPDLDLSLLYRRVEASDDNAIDVGVRLPLPIFRAGDGRVAALDLEARAAAARRVRSAGELGRAIAAAHAELERLLAEATMLRDAVLPEMEAIVTRAQARVDAGDASLVELLAARTAAVERRVDRLEALRDAHEAFAQIEALVGR